MAFIVFVYDFDDSKWKETEQLFPHDNALLLDKDKKEAYLWAGSRVEESEKDIAFEKATAMMKRYRLYELIPLDDSTIPLKVQKEVDILLGDNADDGKDKIPRTRGFQFFVLFGIFGVAMSLAVLINNLTMLSWDNINYYETNRAQFTNVFELSAIFGLVVVCCFGVQFLAASATRRMFLIFASLTSAAIALGTFLYIGEGELIFSYAGMVTEDSYLILRADMRNHLLWIAFSFLSVFMVNAVSILIVMRETKAVEVEEIDVEEMQRKSRPSILRDRKKKIEKISPPQ